MEIQPDQEVPLEVTRPPHSASAEVEALTDALKVTERGQLVDYAQIAGIIGENPQAPRGRNILARAISRLVDEHGIVFVTVRGQGVQREGAGGIIRHAARTVPALRRKTLRARRIIRCADLSELAPEERTQFILTSSTLGVIASITTPKFLGKLELKAVDASNELRPGRVMQLFIGTQSNN